MRSKPTGEFGGKSILWHKMKLCSSNVLNNFIDLLIYKGFFKKEYFSNYLNIEIIKSEFSENNLIRLNSNKPRYKLKWKDKFEIDQLIKDTAETNNYINKHFKKLTNILLKLINNIKSY